MQIVLTFFASLLFGIGLIVSGLANPAKVQNFLDVASAWDPSLALTMAAAVVTTGSGYLWVFKRRRPVLEEKFQLPTTTTIDMKLVVGAALFGIGWGLVGYCPGPAIVALSLGNLETVIFVAAMLAGMLAARAVSSLTASSMQADASARGQ
jgi:uncharacterized membrane protein YedE/YeeE